MKRILLCLDGTWNASGDKPSASDTNVHHLHESAQHFTSPNQLSFYFRGVGTKPLERIRGGVFGHGLFEQIKEAYLTVVNEYQPETQIIIAGFSRGAFSARCLASLIAECGVLKNHKLDWADLRDRRAIDELWDLYAQRVDSNTSGTLDDFCRRNCHPVSNDLVGAVAVWDTVGALGVPWEIFGDNDIAKHLQERENTRLKFLEPQLSPKIARAYHAVALDEQRAPFRPTLWEGPRLTDGSILQVWFAGSHSNVGGGFADRGLSDISLDWMIRQLSNNHGLTLRPVKPNPNGLWDPIGETEMDQKAREIRPSHLTLLERRRVPHGALVHPSAALRMRGDADHQAIATRAILDQYTVAAN